jgi:hypothetical protein
VVIFSKKSAREVADEGKVNGKYFPLLFFKSIDFPKRRAKHFPLQLDLLSLRKMHFEFKQRFLCIAPNSNDHVAKHP